jgi:hypothetical protein
LAADLLVLTLGTDVLLSYYALTAIVCFSFPSESHPADRTPVLAPDPALPLSPLEKQFKGGTGLIPDEDLVILVTQ